MLWFYRWLYNLSTQTYFLSIRLVSLFSGKAKKWVDGRRGIFEQLEKIPADQTKIWIHVASLGEYEQGRPIIDELEKTYPDAVLVITFFSPSGYEVVKKRGTHQHVYYLPAESASNAARFIKLIDPSLAIFIKYEFWYHYLTVCKQQGVPLILASAIFRPSQPFFKWYGQLHRVMLHCFQHIFVQDQPSADLLAKVDYKESSIIGDTRFDRVHAIKEQNKSVPEVEEFVNDQSVFVAGSTWPADENLLAKLINQTKESATKFIIAPHQINENYIKQLESGILSPCIRYSDLEKTTNIAEYRILIINNIGLLSLLYQYGHLAYIGGGFGKGIHNTLEAAVHGLPVIFGPNYQRFKEARDMIKEKGAFSISNSQELVEVYYQLTTNTTYYNSVSASNTKYLVKNLGATKRVIAAVNEILN